jgi:hypothetical protein
LPPQIVDAESGVILPIQDVVAISLNVAWASHAERMDVILDVKKYVILGEWGNPGRGANSFEIQTGVDPATATSRRAG